MPSIRNPYLPAIANTWSQPQYYIHKIVSSDIANSFVINAAFGDSVFNAHTSVLLNGIAPDIVGLYSAGVGSQVMAMDKNQDLAIGGNFISFKNGKRINWGTPPTASNPTIASGTIYLNTTNSYQTIDIPCYASTAGTAGTVAVAYGSSSTPSTIYTQYVSGSTSSTAQAVIHLRVPPQWYYELTATGVTVGTPTMVQE